MYGVDAKNNRIPDYSWVGYERGEQAIPDVPVVVTVAAISGDHTQSILSAIDRIP
jgi:hypothetical protein